MNDFRHRGLKPLFRIVLGILAGFCFSACSHYDYQGINEVRLFDRAQTQVEGRVEVTATILSPEESTALFGTFVNETGVQPVWLRIRNNDPVDYFLYSISIDPEYFSPHEAAWKNHFTFGAYSNVKMSSVFRQRAIHPYIPAGETVSGFIYTRLDKKVKAISVDLKTEGSKGKSFFFYFHVPGEKPETTGLKAIIDQQKNGQVVKLNRLPELRRWIERLPPTVFGPDNTTPADPLNLVMIGNIEDIMSAFIMRGWKPAEETDLGALWKMAKSFFFGAHYLYSPVSPLYLFDRRQDLALQKARETINERNHLRLWVAPASFQGQTIITGQVSRDIGVRLTGRLSPPTTHVIDPEVDEARWYLEQDLVLSQRVIRLGLAEGIGFASEMEPRHNLMGDPYYTDGLRLVLFFSDIPTSFMKVKLLPWESPEDIRYLYHEDY
jgi:hypothetical protein